MATYDTTVSIVRESGPTAYSYKFWQFNPYNSIYIPAPSSSNGNDYPTISPDNFGWEMQSVNLGQNKDWARIQAIIQGVLTFVSNFIQIFTIAPLESTNIFALGISYAIDFIDTVINGPQSLSYGILEGQIFSSLLSNRRVGDIFGSHYLLVGTLKDNGQPRIYYKNWNPTNNLWEWGDGGESILMAALDSLQPASPNSAPPGTITTRSLTADVYQYSDTFIPFSYKISSMHNKGINPDHDYVRDNYQDQIAYLRNGQVSQVLPLGTYTVSDADDKEHVNKFFETLTLNYSVYQNAEEASKISLYTPWGGILAYKPQVYTIYAPTNFNGLQNYIGEGVDKFSGTWNSQGMYTSVSLNPPSLNQAIELKLLMCKDEQTTGNLPDYIVDKVAIDDGYQIYNTHMRYESTNAIYNKSLGSVIYNQVRITTGDKDYSSSIKNNGWIEKYIYNGASPKTEEGDLLPFDPSTDTRNPYYLIESEKSQQATNANTWLNPVFGQTYCQRIIKYDVTDEDPRGIEMERQCYYYTSYNQTPRKTQDFTTVDIDQYILSLANINTQLKAEDRILVSQVTNGNLMTLQVNVSAPDNTTHNYIENIANNAYLLTTNNNCYDSPGLEDNNSVLSGFSTLLPLSQTTNTYHYASTDSTEGIIIPQANTLSTMYAFQLSQYQNNFLKPDTWLWNPKIQIISKQTRTLVPADEDFVITSAVATIWNYADNTIGGKTYWYPYANYRWIGRRDSNSIYFYDTSSLNWNATNSTELVPTQEDWELASYIRDIENNIIHNTVNVQGNTNNAQIVFQGARTTVIYDQYKSFNIAKIISPNSILDNSGESGNDLIRFCGFEDYEDYEQDIFSNAWLVKDSNNNLIPYYIHSSIINETSYAGEKSLFFTHPANYPTLYWSSNQPYNANTPDELILSFYCMAGALSANSNTLTVNFFAQVESQLEIIPLGNPWIINFTTTLNWQYQQKLIALKSLINQAGITSAYKLLIGFTWNSEDTSGLPTFFLDILSLMPLSSMAQFKIYDNQIKLLKASIDQNGLTSRMVYDSRQRLIGTVIGQGNDQQVVSCPVLYYSRDNSVNNDNFNNTDPNATTMIQAASGGQYFDFRTNGNFMNWSSNQSSNLSTINGGLQVISGASAINSLGVCTQGVGLRVQVIPNTADGQLPNNTTIELKDASGTNSIIVSWSYDNNNNPQFIISEGANILASVPAPQSADDWLLIIYASSIYFFANGQCLTRSTLSAEFAISGPNSITARLTVPTTTTSTDAVIFKDIMFIQDPRMSTNLLDGAGKIRQTQVLAELASTSTPTNILTDIENEQKTILSSLTSEAHSIEGNQ